MKAHIIPVTHFAQNCTLLVCMQTNRAAVVDPGGDIERILGKAREVGASIEKILLTHGHIDHAGAAGLLAERLSVPIEGPQREDLFWLEALNMQARQFGFDTVLPVNPDRWLEHGDTVCFGEVEVQVRHCPGHTPGHVVFFHEPSRLALVGDVLFKGSIGRTDFPRGNHEQLLRSIREQLWPLGDEVQFIPGHGPVSTFGAERRSNPFVAG